jgi:hypothetical protein
VGCVPPAALAQQAPQVQLSSIAEPAVAGCVLHESEGQTWQVKEVTLSALPADPYLTVVATAAAETAAIAHPGAAPPDFVHSLQYKCPYVADFVCLALRVHGTTPSASESSSSSARLLPYP